MTVFTKERPQLRGVIAAALALGLLLAACGGGGSKAPGYEGPPDTIAFAAQDADGSYGLYLLNAAAEAPQPHLLVSESAPISDPRWSPTGARIAYVTGEDTGSRTLRVVDAESGDAHAAGTGTALSAPAWSPDGERVAFAADGALRIYDIEAAAAGDVADVDAALAVDWSSRGRLAVASQGGLFLIDPDGGNREDVTDAGAAGLRWSPDGKRLAYYGGVAELPEVFVVTPGEEPLRVADGLRPAWSRDGKQLAYERAEQDAPEVTDIYAVAAPDGEPVQLTQSITLDQHPTWSPDGARVAYVAQPDLATGYLCIIDVALRSGDCPTLPAGMRAADAAWSPR